MNAFFEKTATVRICMLLLIPMTVLLGANAHCEPGIEIREKFVPGVGDPIGSIVFLEGESVIMHAGDRFGYRCRTGLPIFMRDTLSTFSDGRVKIRLNDGSSLALGTGARIVINRSIYNASDRSGFVNIVSGKARFMIRKLTGFRRSEFKVKSRTAIIGVRGSDFVVEASGEITEITTFEKTSVEVAGIKKPEKIVVLEDFERVRVDWKGRISEVEKLIREDIDRIRREFLFSRTGGQAAESFEKAVLVPKEELVAPDSVSGTGPVDTGDIDVSPERKRAEDMSLGEIDRVVETHREDTEEETRFKFPAKPNN